MVLLPGSLSQAYIVYCERFLLPDSIAFLISDSCGSGLLPGAHMKFLWTCASWSLWATALEAVSDLSPGLGGSEPGLGVQSSPFFILFIPFLS